MPRKKKAETENNIEIQYIHTPLDNGAELVTASVPEKMTQEEFEKSILAAVMQEYQRNDKRRQYSVFPKENAYAAALTLEKVRSLAVGIHSNLAKVLELNNYLLQYVTIDAYMGRAYECIYSNINTDYKLTYPEPMDGDDPRVFAQVQAEIENFNKFVDIKDLIRDAVSGTFLEGNYSTYLRLLKKDGGVVSAVIDHYPLEICYPSDYCIDADSILEFNIKLLQTRLSKTYTKTKKTKKALYFKDMQDEIKNNYPDEVYQAYMNKEDYVSLDKLRTGCMKVNDMDRKFGVSPLFKALKALIVLDNIEAADVADSKARSKKIIFQKLRKELLGPTGERKGIAEMEYAHQAAMAALDTNFCLYTAPPFVEDLSYVVDKSTNDNTSDSIKQYTSKLLTALGISFADSELSSYSTANISVEQLMRTINGISEQLEKILNKYYQIYLEEIGLPKELAPTISITDSEMMEFGLRKDFASFIYSTLNVSRDTAFKLVGLDIDDEKQKRIKENEEGLDEIFKPRETAFNRSKDGLTDDIVVAPTGEEKKAGRPASSDDSAKQAFDQEYSKEVRQ